MPQPRPMPDLVDAAEKLHTAAVRNWARANFALIRGKATRTERDEAYETMMLTRDDFRKVMGWRRDA